MEAHEPPTECPPQVTKVVVGVDGGGTKTECCLMDPHTRREIARGSGPGSNVNSVGEEFAKASVKKAVRMALEKAREALGEIQVVSACLSMAGANREEDSAKMRQLFRDLFPAGVPLLVNHDSYAALASGTEGSMLGCVLISGTGTCAVAFAGDGTVHRASGWGPMFRDGGSSYEIAKHALAAVARAEDGRGQATQLTRSFLKHLRIGTADDLLTWAYKPQQCSDIASLAPIVFQTADQGDEIANSIVQCAVDELVGSIQAVSRRSGFADSKENFPLVLAGGVLSHDSVLLRRLLEAIKQKLSNAQVVARPRSPCVGAAWIACASM